MYRRLFVHFVAENPLVCRPAAPEGALQSCGGCGAGVSDLDRFPLKADRILGEYLAHPE